MELCSYDREWNTVDSFKAESLSSCSSSPKSMTVMDINVHLHLGGLRVSIISDLETEADRIANDLDYFFYYFLDTIFVSDDHPSALVNTNYDQGHHLYGSKI